MIFYYDVERLLSINKKNNCFVDLKLVILLLFNKIVFFRRKD